MSREQEQDDDSAGWADYDNRLRQQEEEAREACAFAAAVGIVADYLAAHSQIPQQRITKILFTLADWPDNPPAQGNH